MTVSTADPRRLRTRAVLVSAFVSLARQRRYHEIRIVDILAAAGVSRSTFYAHFAGKHVLLATSMSGAMLLLARVPFDRTSPPQLASLLEHFRAARVLARGLLRGEALRAVRVELIGHVETCLAALPSHSRQLPRRIAAHALADGMLSPVLAWLSNEADCDADRLAVSVCRSSRAMLSGLLDPGG